MSAAHRRRWGVTAAALMVAASLVTSSLLPAPALGAGGRHHHAPGASALARSRHAVTIRERQVREAAGRLGAAQHMLARLNVTAEIAVEAYDGAKVKLSTAQRDVHTAHLVLAGANAQVSRGEAKADGFARAAYESNGLSNISAYLGTGGPAELVARAGAINAISTSVHETVQRLVAARIYQGVVSRQAETVQVRAAAAARDAAATKATAVAAVRRQQHVLSRLRRQRSRLQSLLAGARSTASRLERAHLAALARARARAAAAAPSATASSGGSPFAGETTSTSGTVTAATAVAALHEAESQIGKPYQWGAAGPDRYDCSGLVMWSYSNVGVHLDHWTGDQWNEGAHVSQGQLRPGDLVFFAYNTSDPATIHHVGMYVGNGQMVDAPFTGADVRYDSAYRSDYIGAVRPYQR